MKINIFLTGLIIILISQAGISAPAPAYDPYIFDSNRMTIGAGVIYQQFFVSDNFRKGGSYGISGDKDKISNAVGFDVNIECLLNKTLPKKSKYGLAAGYRFEFLTGGYEYSFGYSGTLKRRINVWNNIIYCSASYPIDRAKYCFAGLLAGIGPSKFDMILDWSNTTLFSDYKKTSWGGILPFGAFIDWGSDGIGGRAGAELDLSFYSREDKVRPSTIGGRLYVNLRYALL